MQIINAVEQIREDFKAHNDFKKNPIDLGLPVIPPFKGNAAIKLIVIGQDPTIQNTNTRNKIRYTLNLDKNNALKTYLVQICAGLGISIENVFIVQFINLS